MCIRDRKVAKLGPKAYEQCAGFLRVPGARHKLDASAVHPESYGAALAVLEACGFAEGDIGTEALAALPQKAAAIGLEALAERAGVGVPTLQDILAELQKPGRDMRDELPPPLLRTDVMKLEDLRPGMQPQALCAMSSISAHLWIWACIRTALCTSARYRTGTSATPPRC